MIGAKEIDNTVEDISSRWYEDEEFVSKLHEAATYSRAVFTTVRELYMTGVNYGEFKRIMCFVERGIWRVERDDLWIVPKYHDFVDTYYTDHEDDFLRVYRVLISHGADPDLRNESGESLLQCWERFPFAKKTIAFFTERAWEERGGG